MEQLNAYKISANVSVNGLNEFRDCTAEVVKKAEELELAVQRLNECELEITTSYCNPEPSGN